MLMLIRVGSQAQAEHAHMSTNAHKCNSCDKTSAFYKLLRVDLNDIICILIAHNVMSLCIVKVSAHLLTKQGVHSLL